MTLALTCPPLVPRRQYWGQRALFGLRVRWAVCPCWAVLCVVCRAGRALSVLDCLYRSGHSPAAVQAGSLWKCGTQSQRFQPDLPLSSPVSSAPCSFLLLLSARDNRALAQTLFFNSEETGQRAGNCFSLQTMGVSHLVPPQGGCSTWLCLAFPVHVWVCVTMCLPVSS